MIIFWKAVILGIVEGLTEFLPISSTGHLIVVNQFISFSPEFTKTFDIVIQFGAILAVLVFFRKELWPFGPDKSNNLSTWYKSIFAVLPALVLGALFGGFIHDKLFSPIVVAVSLFVGGIILIFVEKIKKEEGREKKIESISGLTYKNAFLVGLFQCIAMIPGISRSAATIIGGMILGSSRSVAAEFSFFLAIPTIAAASGYSLLKSGFSITGTEVSILVVGLVVSFIVALFVIKFLMNYIKTHNFKIFGYYRIILAILIICLLYLGVL